MPLWFVSSNTADVPKIWGCYFRVARLLSLPRSSCIRDTMKSPGSDAFMSLTLCSNTLVFGQNSMAWAQFYHSFPQKLEHCHTVSVMQWCHFWWHHHGAFSDWFFPKGQLANGEREPAKVEDPSTRPGGWQPCFLEGLHVGPHWPHLCVLGSWSRISLDNFRPTGKAGSSLSSSLDPSRSRFQRSKTVLWLSLETHWKPMQFI